MPTFSTPKIQIPETGLHNLMDNKRKAKAIKDMLMRDLLTDLMQLPVGSHKDVQKVTDLFLSIAIKYYGGEYPISLRGVTYSEQPGLVNFIPLNLTTYILLGGFDMPPHGLPMDGEWEGEEYIYTFKKAANTLDNPTAILTPKLTV